MSPAFSPERIRLRRAPRTRRRSPIAAAANDGAAVDVGGTGLARYTVSMPASGSKTIRIAVDGQVRYTLYLVRGALVVGSWNIKRGNSNLEMQGWLVESQQLDVLALQEVYRNTGGSGTDNLRSLRTRAMQHMDFAAAIDYSGGRSVRRGPALAL